MMNTRIKRRLHYDYQGIKIVKNLEKKKKTENVNIFLRYFSIHDITELNNLIYAASQVVGD